MVTPGWNCRSWLGARRPCHNIFEYNSDTCPFIKWPRTNWERSEPCEEGRLEQSNRSSFAVSGANAECVNRVVRGDPHTRNPFVTWATIFLQIVHTFFTRIWQIDATDINKSRYYGENSSTSSWIQLEVASVPENTSCCNICVWKHTLRKHLYVAARLDITSVPENRTWGNIYIWKHGLM